MSGSLTRDHQNFHNIPAEAVAGVIKQEVVMGERKRENIGFSMGGLHVYICPLLRSNHFPNATAQPRVKEIFNSVFSWPLPPGAETVYFVVMGTGWSHFNSPILWVRADSYSRSALTLRSLLVHKVGSHLSQALFIQRQALGAEGQNLDEALQMAGCDFSQKNMELCLHNDCQDCEEGEGGLIGRTTDVSDTGT